MIRRFLCLVGAVGVAGCGGAPPDVVATVDGEPIRKAEFDHWLGVFARSSAAPDAVVPDPPAFERCVAAKRGGTRVAKSELQDRCRQEYRVLRDRALHLLITFKWIEGEAQARGVEASAAEVQAAFEEQREEAFPADAEFRKFLAQTGQTRHDILARTRVDLLSKRLREEVTAGLAGPAERRKAVGAFVKDLTARWRARTECREGYRTVQCENGPKTAPGPPSVAILD